MRHHKSLTLAIVLGAAAGLSRADVITDWNDVIMDMVRQTGGPPCPISRSFALMHTAMYDAVNSVERTHQPYQFLENAPAGTSEEAAAAAAAHGVLVNLFPAFSATLDSKLNDSLTAIPNGPGKTSGITLGNTVAGKMLALRANDGTSTVVTYTPGANPGDWRPTPPNFPANPFDPNWGNTKPWAIPSPLQFRPPAPPSLTSAQYTAAFNAVKELGSINSSTRTAEQTEIAWFWANDRNGTYKPPGQLNYIAQVVAKNRGNSLSENARLFALLNIAMADAAVVAWDAKYDTPVDLWRPIAGIREAATDGNPNTTADPNWEPLNDLPTPAAALEGKGAVNTPPFPAYISGHATFAAAQAAILRNFFGTDNVTFTIGSDDTPGVLRTFNSFSAEALEDAQSRIYLGVHWQFDADEAYLAGTKVGDYVAGNMLAAVPEPSALLGAAIAGTTLLSRRRAIAKRT
jgi:hypothetical protein